MANTNFINECKNRANANRLGQIIVDGIDTPITNSDNLQSFEIDSGCYVDGNIIGSVYAKCLKANFIAEQNNLSDKSLYAKIGVKYADLSNEYINMGKYKVERPNNEITANMSQITAYSDLYTNLDSKYVCNIDYSTGDKTLSDLYADVCTNLGLTPKLLEFINSTIPIADNPFTNGEKNRTVLQTIAKISCSFIDIDNDTNEIDLCWLSDSQTPDYTFYKKDYVSVEGGQVVCGPINCLIIKNSKIDDENVTIKDDESIAENGEHSIIISEDYILHNAELRQQAITSIWNKVKGMKYVDCKLTTYYGKPFLKLGDRIRIYTSSTKYFDTYVLKHNFAYDGTFTSIIESPALTEQEIKTKQDISLGEALRNAQIDINKQKGIITATVETQKEQSSTLDNLIKKNQSESYIEISDAFEGNPIYFSFYGNIHYLYPGSNIYPGANTFMHDSYLSIEYENSSTRMRLPYFDLNYTENLYDEFVIDGTKAYIIKRLNSDLQPLENEIIEELGNVSIPLKNGYNKLKMESFNLNYYIKYNVQNNYTNSFATKAELKITEDAIEGEVSKKADDKEIKGLISTIAGEIELEVEKKVDNSEYTHAKIVAKINDDTSEVLIDADKINITANDVLNLIAGNELNLTSKNMTIVSDNFNVDKYGNVKIQDEGQAGNTNLTIISNENQTYQLKNLIRSDGIFMSNGNQTLPDSLIYMSTVGTGRPQISLSYYKNNSDENLLLSSNYIVLRDGTIETTISPSGIKTPTLTQTSLASSKKNFEKLENALEIISNTDIYKYHLKSQNDDDKKHIGFVIGNKFNYSKDITSEKNDGVDIYSMVSVCLQAIKELNNKIKILEEKICQ